MSDLTVSPYRDGTDTLVKFSMQEFEVDGIHYKNPNHVYERLMVSYKYEGTDTGQPWTHSTRFAVSEQHWLSCATVVAAGIQCTCGEIA